jgi:hypothetical protein
MDQALLIRADWAFPPHVTLDVARITRILACSSILAVAIRRREGIADHANGTLWPFALGASQDSDR